MVLFPKRFLYLSSILFLLLASCSISKYRSLNALSSYEKITQQHITPVINTEGKSQQYITSIDFFNKHLTGLLVVKQTDSVTKHIVLVTELGMKLFDFEVKDSSFTVAYVFEPLNKPSFINALSTNLKNSLLIPLLGKRGQKYSGKENEFIFVLHEPKQKHYFTVTPNARLLKKEVFHKQKRSSKVEYAYSEELQLYTLIICKQYGLFKFKIELNAITTN